jgi:hypothetical protein
MNTHRGKPDWLYTPRTPIGWLTAARAALDQAAASLCRSQWEHASVSGGRPSHDERAVRVPSLRRTAT